MRIWLVIFSLLFFTYGHAKPELPPSAAIASASKYATDAGIQILKQGGNAFDAAIAVATMLNVTEPYNSGLGGGGFILFYSAKRQQYLFIDARETAPKAASHNMYLDEYDQVIPNQSLNGPLAAAIPGLPAALDYLAKRHGKLPLSQTVAPAIAFAEKGIQVGPLLQSYIEQRFSVIKEYPGAAKIFLKDNHVPQVGDVIKQADLANTLRIFSKFGADGFYRGEIAQKLVQGVRESGGVWTLKDLANYRVITRKPLKSQHGDLTLITSPPPSAGGVALATMLNILDHFDIAQMPAITQIQLTIEVMRRAFFDRSHYLGDPAFVMMPIKYLLSKSHAYKMASSITLNKASSSVELSSKKFSNKKQHHTTHFSIIDTEGNMIAATLSLNYRFGSGFIPQGTGVILNDVMDDFSSTLTARNVYGVIGSKANLIASKKRPLSSMTPSFLIEPDKIAILGAPGGSWIPSILLHAVLDFKRGNLPDSWVRLGRYHHQYIPDKVYVEANGLSQENKLALEKMGYKIHQLSTPYSDMQAILWDKCNHKIYAASDPRRLGKATVTTQGLDQR